MAAWFMLFRAIVDIIYAKYVYELYGYAGYVLDINPSRIVFSYIVLAATVLAMPLDRRTVRSFFLFTLVLFLLLPASSYYAMSGQSPEAFALTLLAVWLIWLCMATVPRIALVKPAMPGYRQLIVAASAVGIGYFLVYLHSQGTDPLAGFNFKGVYEIRQESKEIVSGIRAYMLGNLYKALAPGCIAILLVMRKRTAAVLLAAGLLLIMGVLGYKEMAVYAVTPFGFYCAYRLNLSFQQALLLGLVLMSVVAVIWWRIKGDHYPLALLIHRGMVVNAQNNVEYVNFFQENPHTVWGNSFLRGVVDYEYSRKIPEIIGSDRYGVGQYVFSNVGLVGSGYMHLGMAGVCIYALMIGVYAYFIHRFSGLNVLSGSLVFIVAIQIVSADLPSALVTHGGLLAAVLLYTAVLKRGNLGDGKRSYGTGK